VNLFEQLKHRYDRLPASKKSKVAYAGMAVVLCVFVLIIYYARGGNDSLKARQVERERKNFELPHNNVAANSWVETGQAQLEELKKTLGALTRSVEDLKRDASKNKETQLSDLT